MSRVNVKRRIAAAVEGARDAGVDISRIEVDKDGRVIIIAGQSIKRDEGSALDAWIAKNAHAA